MVRRLGLVAACCVIGGAASFAQNFNINNMFPYGGVKAWTGTITIDAVSTSRMPDITTKTTYSATGPLTIADDMMPEGAHAQWPTPKFDGDAGKYLEAGKRWTARAVFKAVGQGKGDLGEPYSETCAGEGTQTTKVQLNTVYGGTYELSIEAPEIAKARCTGTQVAHDARYSLPNILFSEKIAPTPAIAGRKVLTYGDTTVTVTYNLNPVK